MKNLQLHRLITLTVIICLTVISAYSKTFSDKSVTIDYSPLADGSIRITKVANKTDKRIDLEIDGTSKEFNVGSFPVDITAKKSVICHTHTKDGGYSIWSPRSMQTPAEPGTPANAPAKNVTNEESRPKGERKQPKAEMRHETPVRLNSEHTVGYFEMLNQDDFFGIDAVTTYTQKAEKLCRSIDSAKNKKQFIIDNDVEAYLESSKKEIEEHRLNLASFAHEIVRTSNVDIADQESALTVIFDTLNNRLKTREDAYENLIEAVSAAKNDSSTGGSLSLDTDILNYGIVAFIVILLIILTVVTARRKRKTGVTTKMSAQSPAPEASTDNPAIVVRRKTTSILKKQCLDDVVDNPSYLAIGTSDFTPDSAVRNIYIKNTCIKEVYNLYAEDLRNTENPKEDGCMVLGRWVYDKANQTYDISLEDVVFPGDDAVFKEYELNFGGKIKLRIAERLRKLRRETNLQYDLVCWIHSHPGLGVFFSNYDDNVQMQLRHSQHPNFLIAFVVDILTSNQELGIFTFRKDGTMNSKGDITKMYSLEEMYKWSLESERTSFSHDNYFNILENARLKLPSCMGIELNNSSIIDLTQIVIEPDTGITGWAVGTTLENNGSQEFIISSIARKTEKPATGVLGCLICVSNMSFPTVQRLIAHEIGTLSFIMIYSTKQMSLTTIPVINGELLSDEQFYGDVNIEDLKIWTRRKR